MKMSFNAAQRRTLTLTAGGLGGILTDIEAVEEIAAMSKYPTNYPTSERADDVLSHDSTAPYAHPYADAVKGNANG